MKGTTIYFTTEQLWDIAFALNSKIQFYEEWEKELKEYPLKEMNSETKDNTLEYVQENLKTFNNLKLKIENAAKKRLGI